MDLEAIDRIAVLTHGGFPDHAKTAVGLLRYGDQEVAALLDREHAGSRVADHLDGVPDAPVVEGFGAVPGEVDALVIGVAPIGGGFDPAWRPDVRAALSAGVDAVAGLHYRLAGDEEFARLAAGTGADLHDVREPPDCLGVAEGTAGEVDARVVLTVGTDCSVGKMTTTMELVAAARERGVDAAAVPTGQTGILIEGWGIAVDRVVTDFAAGAVERLVTARGDRDLLVVEGQASLGHPAYSGLPPALLHGARPDALVLCHAAGRETVRGYEATPIPPPGECADLYERVAAPVAPTAVRAGSLNTAGMAEGNARAAVDEFGAALGVPATDPVRFDAAELLEAVHPAGPG